MGPWLLHGFRGFMCWPVIWTVERCELSMMFSTNPTQSKSVAAPTAIHELKTLDHLQAYRLFSLFTV